jgi:hypothetical protein
MGKQWPAITAITTYRQASLEPRSEQCPHPQDCSCKPRRNCFLPRVVVDLLVGTGVTRIPGALVVVVAGAGDGFTVVQ